jgi:glycosyltransferase involved in cell wall biosynthesis
MVQSLRDRHEVRVIAPIPWVQVPWVQVPWVQVPWMQTPWVQRFVAPPSPTLDQEDLFPTYFYPPKVMRRRYDQFFWRSVWPTIKHLGKTFQPDLVVGYWLHPDVAAARSAARFFGVPCIAMSGGSDLKQLVLNPARKRQIRKNLLGSDRLIVVSQDLANTATELGMPPQKIDVVYRGVDQERFHSQDRQQARRDCGLRSDAVVLVWCGRFEPVKNPRLLMDVIPKLLDRWGDRLQVLVVGDGALRRELHHRCDQQGLRASVRFEGNLCQSELADRYNAADLMLLTSNSEGVPNVLLESMSCGVPFVSTDVGGVSEIATPGLDRLVPAGDAEAFAAAVVERIESADSISVHMRHRIFQPRSLHETASELEGVFQKVLVDAAMRVAG